MAKGQQSLPTGACNIYNVGTLLHIKYYKTCRLLTGIAPHCLLPSALFHTL